MAFRFLIVFSILLIASCKSDKKQSNGPIILGDPATIVTETDPKYLSDFVDDIQLQTAPADTSGNEPPTTAPADSNSKDTSSQPAIATEKGLSIPFKEVTIFIPGIETKTYRTQNLQNANGASYQLVKGSLNGKQLQISGANITKVSQRYIANVIAKTNMGTLELDALSNTSNWQPLQGNGKVYTISGLDKPQAKNASAAQIRLAVSRAARNKRMSRQNIQKWERSVRNVRSVNQKPLNVVLRSVMWKIEGKDANGKSFQKQIRIDLPA